MDPIRARLCSRNEHKRSELARVLEGWWIELLDAADYPPEDGATFLDNARAKAEFGRGVGPQDEWMLGEDSGLEVVALGGGPGVRSARYGSEDAGGVERLLRELEGAEDRRARYVCELVLIGPDGRELRGSGVLEGRIAGEARGSEGFGYDPVFIPDGEERTVAELGDAWKAQRSHRAAAAGALLQAVGSAAPAR